MELVTAVSLQQHIKICLTLSSSIMPLRSITGILVTGHEKGNIVVWHNVVQFYLTAVAQALQSRATTDTTAGATEEMASGKAGKQSKKDKKAHKKEKHTVLEFTATTQPLCTTLHWHAHAGMYCILGAFVLLAIIPLNVFL
jgi:hypothetical protein